MSYAAGLCTSRRTRAGRSAFTVVELLVLIGIVVVLLSIFIPYVSKNREMANRVKCTRNLATFEKILREYANAESTTSGAPLLPSVIYDAARKPNEYTAFTGPDDVNPFAPASKVQANDVTASLFLLMREGYVARSGDLGLSLFICPSSDDTADRLTDSGGKAVGAERRGNFRSGKNLSYGYCSPFSSAQKFKLNTDWLSSEFAVMADKGPGKDAAAVDLSAPVMEMAKGNSRNHGQAGQNVLFGDGHVAFERTPYCGYHDSAADNIYTAAALAPTSQPAGPGGMKGYYGRKVGPASWGDSYLVPGEGEE